jgi:hypothetical protein
MVATPRLVQLIAKLDGDEVRDEGSGDENGLRAVRNVPDEMDRHLISTAMCTRAICPLADQHEGAESIGLERVVLLAHPLERATTTLTGSCRDRHDSWPQ